MIHIGLTTETRRALRKQIDLSLTICRLKSVISEISKDIFLLGALRVSVVNLFACFMKCCRRGSGDRVFLRLAG